MAEVNEELPQLEEEVESKETSTETEDVSGFVNELKTLGISDPQDLANMAKASREAGQLANLLGTERKENKELRDELIKLKMAAPNMDMDVDSLLSQNVDIKGEIKAALKEERDEARRQQEQAQQALLGTWNSIQQDDDYENVKGIWEEKLKDPNFVYGIQSGTVNPLQSYNRVVRDFYKGYLKKSADAITKLQGAGATTPSPPYLESSSKGPRMDVPTDNKEYFRTLQENVDKGQVLSEEDGIRALDTLLSGGT